MHWELLRFASCKRANDLSLLSEHWKARGRKRRLQNQYIRLLRSRRRIQQSSEAMRALHRSYTCNHLQIDSLCERYASNRRPPLCLLGQSFEASWNMWTELVLHPRVRLLYAWRWYQPSKCWLFSWLRCYQLCQQAKIESWRYFNSRTLRTQGFTTGDWFRMIMKAQRKYYHKP